MASGTPRIGQIQNQDIRRTHLLQLIHDARNLLRFDHDADARPFLVPLTQELGDRGRALAWGNFHHLGEFAAWDVVCEEDVFLGD